MKLTLSNPRQIVTMTFVWVTALFAVDYVKHPRPLAVLLGIKRERIGDAVRLTKPTIILGVNHLCCSGCLDDLRTALQPLTWANKVELDKSALARGAGNQREQTLNDFSNCIRIEIKAEDIPRVDFVALDRAMRDAGFVAEQIEFGGIPHMRLEARVTHMCCSLCQVAVEQGVKVPAQPGAGSNFKWLDNINVDRPQKTVTAYTRDDSVINVGEFIAALNHLGFAPAAVTVSREN
jgi:hypothetical protein